MCDNCNAKEVDWKFKTGEKRSRLHRVTLFKVMASQWVDLKLCLLCARELFYAGEFEFLCENKALLKDINSNKEKYCRARISAN